MIESSTLRRRVLGIFYLVLKTSKERLWLLEHSFLMWQRKGDRVWVGGNVGICWYFIILIEFLLLFKICFGHNAIYLVHGCFFILIIQWDLCIEDLNHRILKRESIIVFSWIRFNGPNYSNTRLGILVSYY